MNVASLELCKELYELSGWGNSGNDKQMDWHGNPNDLKKWIAPSYDLGYLLRKLPVGEIRNRNGKYSAWINTVTDIDIQYASTPEDAAAKLAIELFKKGVLQS